MSKAFKNEQRIVTECMELYKAFPCLWDNRKVIYANREARDHAYELMLEKYRQLFEKATIDHLKKRIENMRASYRREHKRVLLAKQRGEIHVPQLWYYEKMTFLNEVMDFQISEENRSNDCQSTDVKELPSQIKRRSSPSLSSIYLEESSSIGYVGSDLIQVKEEIDTTAPDELEIPASPAVLELNSESESFGTTLGFQLKELDSMQKIFAEKLISDVIYYARLNKLTFKSYLVL